MYCHSCGIHNTDDSMQCHMCETSLRSTEKPQTVKIFTDLTQFPYMALVHSLKTTHPILAIIILPLITMLYILRKMTNTPFFSAILTSKTAKLHITNVEQFQKLQKRSFHKISSFLQSILYKLETRSVGQRPHHKQRP